MKGQPFTLAMYRVKPGKESEFIACWRCLSLTFSELPSPPVWGSLIHSTSDPALFYSFGEWQSAADIATMRGSGEAQEAFAHIWSLCTEMTPGSYELVEHVEIEAH